jgi:hypothetical protein
MKWIGLGITSLLMGGGLAFLAATAFPALMAGRFTLVAAAASGAIFLINAGVGHSDDSARAGRRRV